MQDTTQKPAPRPGALFSFRGNAVAAAGFLTVLDGKPVALNPEIPTTHGESSLPVIGGVSHSLVVPVLPFPEFIRYGLCETFAEGAGDDQAKVTTVRASVNDVQITTRPSPADLRPDTRSISFRAKRLSLAVRSTHPQQGQARFELLEAPEAVEMSLLINPMAGPSVAVPLRVEFDDRLLALTTLDDIDREFAQNRSFFDDQSPRLQSRGKLVFGKSKAPRSRDGYVVCSLVRRIFRGDQPISGNVLVEPGFGTLFFGEAALNGFNRRITLVRIRMGSDPDGGASLAAIDTNGIWN